MNLIITGSHGFLGQHLCFRLEQMGHSLIRVPHRDMDYTVFTHPFDWLFHLAAYGNHYHQTDNREMLLANIVNLADILNLTKEVDYKAFINFSTSSVTLPKLTMYAATKAGGEQLVKGYISTYNKPIINVRPYSIYGPGEAGFRFIPTVFRSCMYQTNMILTPNAVHDWVYIEDFIDALLLQLEKPNPITVEIGTGVKTSNLDIVREIELITGNKCKYTLSPVLRPYDSPDWVCRNPPENWKPKHSLQEGLIKVYESIKKEDTRN